VKFDSVAQQIKVEKPCFNFATPSSAKFGCMKC